MFHPIVYDNIRVILEGAVYDRDLDGELVVTSRSDAMDLATFQRSFHIEFILATDAGTEKPIASQIQLWTSLTDIASEQLEKQLTDHIGCFICISFMLKIQDIRRDPETILHILNEIWGDRPHITQRIGAVLDEHKTTFAKWPPDVFDNKVVLDFHRKIDEGNIEDIPDLIEHCVQSLVRLSTVFT